MTKSQINQKVQKHLSQHQKLYVGWRHHLHQHPEISWDENKTCEYIIARLEDFGLNYQRIDNGIVAYLHQPDEDAAANAKKPGLGLRADIDALPIHEMTELSYKSQNQGVMHACGHDGHTAMLLGAAHYAAAHKEEILALDKRVFFVFQPAEELGGGALKMIEDGLFKDHAIDTIYGMHNWPGLAIGDFAITKGAIMAAVDFFDIKIAGGGGHAAMPHMISDTILTASSIVTQLQTVVSRAADPCDALVISCTSIADQGTAYNVIPEEVSIKGTMRYYSKEVRQMAIAKMHKIIEANCGISNLKGELEIYTTTAATYNHPKETEIAAATVKAMGMPIEENVKPSMGGEDFAYMLEHKPGCYIWLGNGDCPSLHNPKYNFNDDALAHGVSYWINLMHS